MWRDSFYTDRREQKSVLLQKRAAETYAERIVTEQNAG
jgi:hypothetical protein